MSLFKEKKNNHKTTSLAGRKRRTPLVPVLRRQRQGDSEFKASLIYRVSSWTSKTAQRNPVSRKPHD